MFASKPEALSVYRVIIKTASGPKGALRRSADYENALEKTD